MRNRCGDLVDWFADSWEGPPHMHKLSTRILIALLALATLAAACTSSGTVDEASTDDAAADDSAPDDAAADDAADDGADGDSADDGAADDSAADDAAADDGGELTATARGVTADTITVGVTMLDFPELVSSGLSPAGWGDQQAVWEALVADLNDRGGINGRMIEANYEFYSPVAEDQALAACSRLTEDVETFAILAGFVGPVEDAVTCITGTNNTILVGGRQSEERLAQSTAPWVETNSSRARRLEVLYDLLEENGNLTPDSKIAIVSGLDTQAEGEQAAQLLRDRGIEPVVELNNDAAEGDIPSQDSTWAVLAERIASDGADTVLLVGATTGGIRGISVNDLDVETWVLDNDALANLGESVSGEDANGVITATGLTEDQQWEEPSVRPCEDVVAAAVPEAEFKLPSAHAEDEEKWWQSTLAYCRYLTLFEIIATAAGPELTPESFLEAANNMGSFELPGIPFASLGEGKYDASDTFVLAEWQAGEGDDRGGLVAITEPVAAAAAD